MSEIAISTSSLTKTYKRGSVIAVNDLNLTVPRGGVHGFLGPNGSGKTTTLRMLLGLIRAESGSITILDKPIPNALDSVINSVGAIVESPKFFPSFSAKQNLKILAAAIGVTDSKVGEVLNQVGLSGRSSSAFKTLSLGMKQRLAIAATLLKDPEIFIFDEPTNGLDPSGIHEIRETMRALGASGKTVLVSSHILSEIEQIADTVTIIGRGRLLAQGRVSDLMGEFSTSSIRVVTPDLVQASQILTQAGYQVNSIENYLSVSASTRLRGEQISQLLGEHGQWVSELIPQRKNLEGIFLELTAQEHLTITQSHGGRARREKN